MSVLVIAEHDGRQMRNATRSAISAARQLGDEIDVLIAGYQCRQIADQVAGVSGINQVLCCDAGEYQHLLAENLAPLVVSQAPGHEHLIAAATTFGKNLMPRVAAMLDVAQISDVTTIESADTFVRPVYAGNVYTRVQATDQCKVLTVRATAFDPAADSDAPATVTAVASTGDTGLSRFVSQQLTQSPRPELADAEIVVAGGRGIGSAENFRLLEQLADKLGAAVGASRAAVDAGFVANDYQIGQTGKVVAPKLYIAVGISGAIQHLAGMQDSAVIVAINKDPDAPIFSVADYGIVGDLFKVLPELIAALDARELR